MYIYRKQTEIEKTDIRGLTVSSNIPTNNTNGIVDQDPPTENVAGYIVSTNAPSCSNVQERVESNDQDSYYTGDSSSRQQKQLQIQQQQHQPLDEQKREQQLKQQDGENKASMQQTFQPRQQTVSLHPSTTLANIHASVPGAIDRSEIRQNATATSGESPLESSIPLPSKPDTEPNGEQQNRDMNTVAVTGSSDQGSTPLIRQSNNLNGGSLSSLPAESRPNLSVPASLQQTPHAPLVNVAAASISPSNPPPALPERHPDVQAVLEWPSSPYTTQSQPPQPTREKAAEGNMTRKKNVYTTRSELSLHKSSSTTKPSSESSRKETIPGTHVGAGRTLDSSPAVIPTQSGTIFDFGGFGDVGPSSLIFHQTERPLDLKSGISTSGDASTIGCGSPTAITLSRKVGPGAGHLERPADYRAIIGSLGFDELPDPREREWNQSPWNRYLPFNQVTDGRLALFLVLIMVLVFLLCLGMQFVKPSPVQINPTSYVCGEGLVFYPIYGAMLIFLIVGCPIICWNLWWIKDGFGIRNELLLTMAIGVPGFVLYFISPVTMKKLDAGHWNHVNWLVLTFIFAHTITVVLPLISFLRRQRPKARQASAKSNSRLASIFRWESLKSDSPVSEHHRDQGCLLDSDLVSYQPSLPHTSSQPSLISATSQGRVPFIFSPSASLHSSSLHPTRSKCRDNGMLVDSPSRSLVASPLGAHATGVEMTVLQSQIQQHGQKSSTLVAGRPSRRLKGFKGFWAYYGLDAKGDMIPLSDMNPRAFEYALQDSEMFEALCKFSVTVFNAENTKFLQEYEGLRKQVMEYYELVGRQGREGNGNGTSSGATHSRVRQLRFMDTRSSPIPPVASFSARQGAATASIDEVSSSASPVPCPTCASEAEDGDQVLGPHVKSSVHRTSSEHKFNQQSMAGGAPSSRTSSTSRSKEMVSINDHGNALHQVDNLQHERGLILPSTSADLSAVIPTEFSQTISMSPSPAPAQVRSTWRDSQISGNTTTTMTSHHSSISSASTSNTPPLTPFRAGHQLTSSRFKDSFNIEPEEELAASMKSDLVNPSPRRGTFWPHLNPQRLHKHRHHHSHHHHRHHPSLDHESTNSAPATSYTQREPSSSSRRLCRYHQRSVDSAGISGGSGGGMTSTESADSVQKLRLSGADSDHSSLSWFGRGNTGSTRSYHDTDLSQESRMPIEEDDFYDPSALSVTRGRNSGDVGDAHGVQLRRYTGKSDGEQEILSSSCYPYDEGEFDDQIHQLSYQNHSQESSEVPTCAWMTKDPANCTLSAQDEHNPPLKSSCAGAGNDSTVPTMITLRTPSSESTNHINKSGDDTQHSKHHYHLLHVGQGTLIREVCQDQQQIARTASVGRPHSPSTSFVRTSFSCDSSARGSRSSSVLSASPGLPPTAIGGERTSNVSPRLSPASTLHTRSAGSNTASTGTGSGCQVASPIPPKRQPQPSDTLPAIGRSKLSLMNAGASGSDQIDSFCGSSDIGSDHEGKRNRSPRLVSVRTSHIGRPDSVYSTTTTPRSLSPAPSVSAPFTTRLPLQPSMNSNSINAPSGAARLRHQSSLSSDKLTAAPLSVGMCSGANSSQAGLLGRAHVNIDHPQPVSGPYAEMCIEMNPQQHEQEPQHTLSDHQNTSAQRLNAVASAASISSRSNTEAVAAADAVANGMAVPQLTRTPVPAPLLPAYYAIYKTFIKPSSLLPLNLNDEIVQDITMLFQTESCYLEMYEPVVREVQNMVYDNVWRHFVLSIQTNPPVLGSLSRWKRGWKLLFGEGHGRRTGTVAHQKRPQQSSASQSECHSTSMVHSSGLGGGGGGGSKCPGEGGSNCGSGSDVCNSTCQILSPSSVHGGPRRFDNEDDDEDGNGYGWGNSGGTDGNHSGGKGSSNQRSKLNQSRSGDSAFRKTGHRLMDWKRPGSRKIGEQELGLSTMSVVEEEDGAISGTSDDHAMMGGGSSLKTTSSSTRLPSSSPAVASPCERLPSRQGEGETTSEGSQPIPQRVNYFAAHHQPSPSVAAAMQDLQRSFGIHTTAIEMESWTVATTLPPQYQHYYVKYDANR
ncbi:hypothetical protein BGW42_005662 [Actinomortierella wolfii]|nr:hypothetical protein BGW42_005662 [Actinomortierella wolfii]